jgi:small subunit ribosomal protein S5
MVSIPLTRGSTFPHRADGRAGAARVMLRPASEGTGVIAGGAVRVVLELAGVKNGFGKQLGSPNPLNNARAAVNGLAGQRTVDQVAAERGLSVGEMLAYKKA